MATSLVPRTGRPAAGTSRACEGAGVSAETSHAIASGVSAETSGHAGDRGRVRLSGLLSRRPALWGTSGTLPDHGFGAFVICRGHGGSWDQGKACRVRHRAGAWLSFLFGGADQHLVDRDVPRPGDDVGDRVG